MLEKNQCYKIALVGPLPPPSGGMANQLRQLKKLLEESKQEVFVVQTNAPYKPYWISKIKGLRAVFRLVPFLFNLWVTTGKVDLVHLFSNSGWSWHLYSAPAIWIAYIRKTPVIVNYRGGEAETFFSKSFKWVSPSLKKTSAIIVPSGFLKDIFKKWQVQTDVVPNIIDTNKFQSKTDLKHTNCLNIFVARNLEPIYDVATAIRALAIVKKQKPEATMTIAGSGPELQKLQSLVVSLEIEQSVKFTGRVDNAKMNALYNCASVMLNTSLVDNMPNSVLEALAAKVPVVSTNVGGVPYIVEHRETALLVDAADEQAMADAILEITSNNALRDHLVAQGSESIEQYTWDKVSEQLFSIYFRVIQKSVNS